MKTMRWTNWTVLLAIGMAASAMADPAFLLTNDSRSIMYDYQSQTHGYMGETRTPDAFGDPWSDQLAGSVTDGVMDLIWDSNQASTVGLTEFDGRNEIRADISPAGKGGPLKATTILSQSLTSLEFEVTENTEVFFNVDHYRADASLDGHVEMYFRLGYFSEEKDTLLYNHEVILDHGLEIGAFGSAPIALTTGNTYFMDILLLGSTVVLAPPADLETSAGFAFYNLSIVPEPSTGCALLCLLGVAMVRRRTV